MLLIKKQEGGKNFANYFFGEDEEWKSGTVCFFWRSMKSGTH